MGAFYIAPSIEEGKSKWFSDKTLPKKERSSLCLNKNLKMLCRQQKKRKYK